jgi:hypothetical protein
MIAGTTSDKNLGREMVWKLVDLAAKIPSMLLSCNRALQRASLLLGFKSPRNMLDGMMPHLLVKWLESQRSLRDLPLLLMSSFVVERACYFLPNELLSMLLSGGGWNNDTFCLGAIGDDAQTLSDRILTSFVGSVAKL